MGIEQKQHIGLRPSTPENRLLCNPATEATSQEWKGKVGYSILTPVFYDSNNDGIGDIPGITEKLEYLQQLGVNIVHLTPFYPTHLYDIGYDVDDYEAIDPRYGSMEDFKTCIDTAHSKGVRIISDMVLNHTSIHHEWFKQARSSKDNPKRDWYIWRDGNPDGSPPNNWVANFGGSAWQFDDTTGQYYLHTFLPEQPDLNYENPMVREEMIAIMKRWQERGVDGFRLDSVNFIRKAAGFPDAEPNPDYIEGKSHPSTRVFNKHWWYQPDMLDDLRVFTEETGAFMFSEANPPEDYKEWRKKIYRAARSDRHAMINSTLNGMTWNSDKVMDHLEEFYGMLQEGDIASYQTSCHDIYQRTVDRIGEAQARNAALLNLTLPGIPWLYYGDEIGMHGMQVPYDFDNPFQNLTFIRFGYDRTKNPSRLSMAWDTSDHAGFTTGIPVLPVHADYATHNVQKEREAPNSMLRLHEQLIQYRQNSEIIQAGKFSRVDPQNSSVGAYTLTGNNGDRKGVVMNFTDTEQPISLNVPSAWIDLISQPGELRRGEEIDLRRFTLPPDQAIIFESRKNK